MINQVSGSQMPPPLTQPPLPSTAAWQTGMPPPPAPTPALPNAPPPTDIQIEKPASAAPSSQGRIKVLFMLIPFLTILTAFAASAWIIVSRKNEPVNYESRAVPPKPTAAAFPAGQSGCVFSLRYDKDGQVDEALKQEAWAEINKIKARLETGEKAENIVYEITTSVFKYQDNPETNPYLKFNVDQAFNFCFSDLKTAGNMLGADLQNKLAFQNQPPFDIVSNDKIEYAVMLIAK